MAEEGPNFDLLSQDEIPGNASTQTKLIVSRWLYIFTHRGTGFSDHIGSRVKITEISVNTMPNDPGRAEGKVVAEIKVTEGLSNKASNKSLAN